MDSRKAITALNAGRAVVGLALLAAPGPVGRGWIGPDADLPATQLFTRAFGGRDLAIGLGTLLALHRDEPMRGWLQAGMLADGADLAATAIAGSSIPPSGRAIGLVVPAGALAAGLFLAHSFD